jgi:hypothetical protein
MVEVSDPAPGGLGNILGDQGPGRRLGPDETPYRSRLWVNGLTSLDGIDYQPGDPIPFEEAVRQGIIDPGRVVIHDRCTRCKGGKWFTNPRPKGHRLGCGCRFCQPCPRCGGTGQEPGENDGAGTAA